MEADDTMTAAKDAVLDAALSHVPFDGWSEATFRAAVARVGGRAGAGTRAVPARRRSIWRWPITRAAMPRWWRGCRRPTLPSMRYRDRMAAAVRFRLEAATDKEAVRRGTTLFALPQHAADGAQAIWGTADAIWTALGDTSRDLNWYTKRATLVGGLWLDRALLAGRRQHRASGDLGISGPAHRRCDADRKG